MNLLSKLPVYYKGEIKYIELYHGDLTDSSVDEHVDLLIVSAYPGDYSPVAGSLIAALHEKGISVKELSKDMEEDLRDNWGCWLSKKLSNFGMESQYDRILCFEPPTYESPTDVVSNVFQSIMPFIYREDFHVDTISMPLIATGIRGTDSSDMLEVLLDTAVHWLASGLPVKKIKIVEYAETKAAEMKGAFNILKKKYAKYSKPRRKYKYDAFLSYSHKNTAEVLKIKAELEEQNPDLNLFFDRQNLYTGAAWQQELYEALDDCQKVVVFYSPTYLQSKVCKEEYNIAMFRHRESKSGVLCPVLLHSTQLPTYMQLIQFIDARSSIQTDIHKLGKDILKNMR